MPVALTADERAALRRPRLAVRVLIDLYLDSGRASFWDGGEHWAYDGTTYYAVSEFGEVSAISMGLDLGAEGIELRLSGTKLKQASIDPLDPGALFGTIEEEDYQLRRVNVRYAFFDPDAGADAEAALLLIIPGHAGLIDQIRQVEEISEESGEAEDWLIVSCESVARRYGVRTGRTRSHEDQQEIWPGDTFFKFTAPTTAKQGSLWWGRKAPITRTINGGVGPVIKARFE